MANESADDYFRRKLGNREMKGGGDDAANIGHGRYRFIVTRFESVLTENSGMVSGIKLFVEQAQVADYRVEDDWPKMNPENSRCKSTIMWDHAKIGKFAPERFAEFTIALFGLASFGVTEFPAFPKPSDPESVRRAWNDFFDRVDARHKEMRSKENVCRGMLIDCRTSIGKKDREAWDKFRLGEIGEGPHTEKPQAPFINLRWSRVEQTPEDVAKVRALLDAKSIP